MSKGLWNGNIIIDVLLAEEAEEPSKQELQALQRDP
jgi:hypothetical protein